MTFYHDVDHFESNNSIVKWMCVISALYKYVHSGNKVCLKLTIFHLSLSTQLADLGDGTDDTFEPAHDKTYNKTCATSKDSAQLVYLHSIAMIPVYSSLDSLEAVEGICDQRRLWSDWADSQTNLILRWSHKSYYRFCRALAHFLFVSGNMI